MTRTDFYNAVADTAIETALATLLAAKTTAGGEGAIPLNRKEALRFLVRRVNKKDVGNLTRVRAANENPAAQ